MKKRMPGAVLLSICVFAPGLGGEALASESYRTELTLDLSQSSDDGGYDYESIDATARIYFAPVNVKDHPLAEASFLERAGSVVFTAGRAEAESSTISGDTPFFVAGMTYARPESPFVAQVGYQTMDWDFDTPDATLEGEQYLLGAGWFVAPTGLISLTWVHGDSELKAEGSPDRTYEDDIYSIGAKYVGKLADDTAYNIESALTFLEEKNGDVNESNRTLVVVGDYYFSRRLSFGGGLKLNRGDDRNTEGNTYIARGKWFITQLFSAELKLSEFIASRSDQEDETTTDFTLAVRF